MADLGCSPNALLAFDYLVGKGISHEQAAGIVGNLQWESKLNPRLELLDSNKKMSRGIAMWQPSRWQNLLTFAVGRDPWAIGTQLEFLWHELQSDPSLGIASILASTTVDAATRAFQDKFERPLAEKAHTNDRIALANALLFACPRLKPPLVAPRRGGVFAAAAALLALVGAAGYGVYKTLAARAPEPGPPEPEPILRPLPFRRAP